MPSLLTIAAPFALALPVLGQGFGVWQGQGSNPGITTGAPQCTPSAPDYDTPRDDLVSPAQTRAAVDLDPLSAFRGGQTVRQVRIERRVTIRISPHRGAPTNSLLARLPSRSLTTRFEEREMDECLDVGQISGVQTGNGNRLLLFLDDRRIVSLGLERSCRARDFYSGFYVERREDGKLCVRRDQLHSRTGAKCEVARMRQLVAVDD